MSLRGEGHAVGCDDTGQSQPAVALQDLPVTFQQGASSRELDRVDATAPGGVVAMTITVPADARPGTAQITVGAAEPALITIGDQDTSGTAATDLSRAAVRPAPADGGYQEALATGVLRADPATGCLWLQGPDGAATVQLLLQGDSYRVDLAAAPPAVLDGDTVVARIGHRVELGGGITGRDRGVEGCPVRPSVFVGYFFERPGTAPVPPTDPAGAELCKGDGSVASECHVVGPEQAEGLAAALASARQVSPGGAECAAPRAHAYRVIWRPQSGLVDPVSWSIPVASCLPMAVGGTEYDLDQDVHDLVVQLWDAAAMAP